MRQLKSKEDGRVVDLVGLQLSDDDIVLKYAIPHDSGIRQIKYDSLQQMFQEWEEYENPEEILKLIREMREERTKQLKDKMLDFMKGAQNE